MQARVDFDALDVPALLNALVADGAAIESCMCMVIGVASMTSKNLSRRGFCARANAVRTLGGHCVPDAGNDSSA